MILRRLNARGTAPSESEHSCIALAQGGLRCQPVLLTARPVWLTARESTRPAHSVIIGYDQDRMLFRKKKYHILFFAR